MADFGRGLQSGGVPDEPCLPSFGCDNLCRIIPATRPPAGDIVSDNPLITCPCHSSALSISEGDVEALTRSIIEPVKYVAGIYIRLYTPSISPFDASDAFRYA